MQACHAVYELVSIRHEHGIPNMVVIGVKNQFKLKRVVEKLKLNQIPHYAWSEPDYDYGLTSVATAPLSLEEKVVLKEYQVLKFVGGDGQLSCGLTADIHTSSPVAQG